MKHIPVELRERGYRQGETIVYDYLRALRKPPEGIDPSEVQKITAVHSAPQIVISAREAARLFVCNPPAQAADIPSSTSRPLTCDE